MTLFPLSVTAVVDYLVSENVKSAEDTLQEQNEMVESMENNESNLTKESSSLIFTHEQSIDHVDYYFNEALKNTIGKSDHLKK